MEICKLLNVGFRAVVVAQGAKIIHSGTTRFEKDIEMDAVIRGDTVLRDGWPDFLIVKPDGSLVFVEVKGKGDGLRENQEKLLKALVSAGLVVEVVYEMKNGEVAVDSMTKVLDKENSSVA